MTSLRKSLTWLNDIETLVSVHLKSVSFEP